MEEFIQKSPKAELHIHLEGTLEPELMFNIAKRNQIKLPFLNAEDARKAYQFSNLQDFLNIYYRACEVLRYEQDFFDLTWSYLQKLSTQNVKHAEFFFDPQTHLARQVSFEVVLNGIEKALIKGREELNLSTHLIVCFLRDLSESSAFEVLEMALDHKDKIIGVGLDSAEKGHPPSKFKNVFKKAKAADFKAVAHAGEEGPPEYIWEALNLLNVDRIDHGVRCLEDPTLVKFLAKKQIPLTVCPLSNIKLKVFNSIECHPLKKMLDNNLCATINSDDPAYFGHLNENFLAAYKHLDLTEQHIITLLNNSFKASFLSEASNPYSVNAA